MLADLPDNLANLASGLAKELTLKNIQKLLDPTKKLPANIIEISNLDINNFKDLDIQESEKITAIFGIKKIRELADITYSQLIENSTKMKERGIAQAKLELVITAAKYISNAAEYRTLEGQKIVLVGLDNAGKTALLNAIKKEVINISDLKPTQSVQRQTLNLQNKKLYIYELGGQEVYRNQYLEDPERYILGTNTFVFLIDMQDQGRYDVALKYLGQILSIVKYLNEKPEFIILLHKSDPDILKFQPMFREKIDHIMEKVRKIFQQHSFRYQIHISSIHNILGLSKSFEFLLKKLLTGDLEKEKESTAVFELIERILNMILNIESDLTDEISSLSEKMYRMDKDLSTIKKVLKLGESETAKEPIFIEDAALADEISEKSAQDLLVDEIRKFLIDFKVYIS